MIKGIIVGSVVLVVVVAASAFLLMNSQPTGNDTLETYQGKLTAGNSLFHNGTAIVEMTFEDGRGFTAPEQLAAEANMEIGNTYQIRYNSTAPSVAVEIKEVQP